MIDIIVYTYAKFFLQDFIKAHENKLNDLVLTEEQEKETKRLIKFYKIELKRINGALAFADLAD